MNYETIISQVSTNLGYDAYDNVLKNNIMFAIYWAELELARESGSLKEDYEFEIKDYQMNYLLPEDVEYPKGITIRSNDGGYIDLYGVEYEELMRYVNNPDNEQKAKYKNRILYSIRNTKGRKDFTIYPAINGTIVFSYENLIKENLYMNPNHSPQIHRSFHTYIIDGATYYLMKQEYLKRSPSMKIEELDFYQRMIALHEKNFEKGKIRYAAFSNKKDKTPLVQPYIFYDKPENY